MKKGLLTLFAAITLLGASSAFATAPTIGTIPDVTIGDSENNGPSDNNFFIFSNAFAFDTYVTDDLTTWSDLKWSFDEGDPAQQWYTINDKNPVHVGTAAQAGDTSVTAAHVNPAPANELRSGNTHATFRDIVFSPPPGSGPYPDPTSDHSAGKVVTFYVSDGTYAASKDIIVKTVDNGFDALTTPAAFEPFRTDSFATNTGLSQWVTGGATSGDTTLNQFSHDNVTGAYRIQVFSNASRFRFAAWNNQRAGWLPYSVVGSDRYVRAKYYMYATGHNAAANIPNFNVKLQQRFAVTAALQIQTHDTNAPDLNLYQELRPNSDVNNPSIYRIDFDPIDVPYMQTASAIGNPQPEEGIQSSFEAFVILPQDNGTIAMTQQVIGTYPISALGAATKSQVYTANLTFSPVDTNVDYDTSNQASPAPAGTFPTVISPGTGSITNGTNAVTFSTVATPANGSNGTSNRVGNLERLFFGGTFSERMRIDEDEIYKVRWHITSTRATSQQGWIWLNNRTAKFGWTNYLQLAGGTATGANGEIAKQAIPGTGSLNPDKATPGEAGGYYTVLVNTPLDRDVRPELTGTAEQRMPILASAAEYGVGPSNASNRDLRVTAIAYDTLTGFNTGGVNAEDAEATVFTVDNITITAHNQIAD